MTLPKPPEGYFLIVTPEDKRHAGLRRESDMLLYGTLEDGSPWWERTLKFGEPFPDNDTIYARKDTRPAERKNYNRPQL